MKGTSTTDEIRLARRLELLGRLAAKIAHDTRNQIAKMEMGIDFIANAPAKPDAGTQSVLDLMGTSLKRINKTMGELLEFSATAGPQLKPEALHPLIDQSLSAVQSELDGRGIQAQKNFAPNLPLLSLDGGGMKRALSSLFHHVLQTLPEGSTMEIKTQLKELEKKGGRVGHRKEDVFRLGERVAVIEVAGTEHSLPRDFLTAPPKAFYASNQPVEKTSLGLAMAVSMIEAQGGTMEMEERSAGSFGVVIRLKL